MPKAKIILYSRFLNLLSNKREHYNLFSPQHQLNASFCDLM